MWIYGSFGKGSSEMIEGRQEGWNGFCERCWNRPPLPGLLPAWICFSFVSKNCVLPCRGGKKKKRGSLYARLCWCQLSCKWLKVYGVDKRCLGLEVSPSLVPFLPSSLLCITAHARGSLGHISERHSVPTHLDLPGAWRYLYLCGFCRAIPNATK